MSKLVEAFKKSQAVEALKSPGDDDAREAAEAEARLARALEAESENVVEIEPGRDLILTEEPLEYSEEALDEQKVVHPGMRDKATEIAFRDLRTLVTQKTGGGNAVILVTSVCRGGGASFVSFNLAAAYAMDRTRTAVVMDCNFRRPAGYTEMLEDDSAGISDFLADPSIKTDQVIQKCGIPRLRLISCGSRRHDVADLVNSRRAERLIKDLKKRFRERMIFLDTAPITQSADARVLMQHCDHVLLVVPYGKVDEQQILSASELIPGDKFLGVVFNDEPRVGSGA